VPYNQTFPDRILAAYYVQIRSADSRQRNANDCLARTRTRPLDFFNSNLVFAVKDGGSHEFHGVFCLLITPLSKPRTIRASRNLRWARVLKSRNESRCEVLGFDWGILLIESGPPKPEPEYLRCS
jgi:hypothetical protein